MAGKGPPPKRAEDRARRNSDPVPLKLVSFLDKPLVIQPDLPVFSIEVDKDTGEGIVFEWPERTRQWWQMWADSPLSNDFTAADWDFLLDTALLHARYWSGDFSQASELRLRVAKFGQTPEDRLRLRITFSPEEQAPADRLPVKEDAPRRRARPRKIIS